MQRSLTPGATQPECCSSGSAVFSGRFQHTTRSVRRQQLFVTRCNAAGPNKVPKAVSTEAPLSDDLTLPGIGQTHLRPDMNKRAGKDVETYAMLRAVEKHMSFQPPSASSQYWNGSKEMVEAYARCGDLTAEYAKTFYLGTQLMTPEKARAIWAIYVWCRRTDELVDGPNASRVTPAVLDRWEERLEETFAGRPYDILDAALADTVAKFPVDIQSFRDMVEGMRMDLVKPRYETFDELYEYCYRVAGTVGLMTTPVMGIDPSYKGELAPVYQAALALGTANQLTNILRDVGEDAYQRNRIYVPLSELEQFGLTERGILNGEYVSADGKVDKRWQGFMKFQIDRAREFFKQAEHGVLQLDRNARWPVWSALIIYSKILDVIEKNNYNNFTMRAYVPKLQKLAFLPITFAKAQFPTLL